MAECNLEDNMTIEFWGRMNGMVMRTAPVLFSRGANPNILPAYNTIYYQLENTCMIPQSAIDYQRAGWGRLSAYPPFRLLTF